MTDESAMAFWSPPADELLQHLNSSSNGLSTVAAEQKRIEMRGKDLKRQPTSPWSILAAQFKSPIILLLFGSAVLSYVLQDHTNATIILVILVASTLLSFFQEWSAANAVEKLLAVIQTEATVLRGGQPCQVPVNAVVPGDVILLSAGNVIPGDGRLLESRDLYVNEAALTGESFPAEKSLADLDPHCPLSHRINSVFLGTHVISGKGTALIVETGAGTEFGKVSARLQQRPPESGFERGLRDFGNLLITVTFCIVVVVFSVKIATHQPLVDALLFSLALAVGMTPQLLPAITSVVMATGAKTMAREKVIVKQLIAIENFGSMTVLCSDKTGTLTEGEVRLHAAHDANGEPSDSVLRLAYFNSVFQAGFNNPIDRAIRDHQTFDTAGFECVDEIPYDFARKRLSVLVSENGQRLMITKGMFEQILACCTSVALPDQVVEHLAPHVESLRRHFLDLSNQGYRVLGLASRSMAVERIAKSDERDMTFVGFLIFADPPKTGIAETLRQLRGLGISLKIITGDNRVVAAAVGRQVGIDHPDVLTGSELRTLNDDALRHRVNHVDLFAEIEPNQKEQIILALKRTGQVVGFMGDGINDASALHAADVGISVASAVDVAREAAQVVLLEHDLSVLIRGVREGRKTFANTLKYVFVAISGNFGYMFSLAVASLFLPFEPLLPGQILLINLLADIPAMALATDSVDPELIDRPRRWDVSTVTRFMLTFGLTSSTFDFLTFGAVLYLFHADETLFHTLWFIESLLTGLLILLIVRTQRPFFRSQTSVWLALATGGAAIVAVSLPYLPLHQELGFTPPTWTMILTVFAISGLYALGMETAKGFFYRGPRTAR
ncbi:magnesium-translocating P-type ATPase [Schlesneria paludicola]|uniref:magnesium-translocating P-type ATPase n=1 Tax=Schlesneria paludicola TaxID=360056 RepID=UPI00029B53E7|nr:magnesium-translocating P-type ATPase [Schlesneria paludicola]